MFEILAAAIGCQGKQQNQKCGVTNCMAPSTILFFISWNEYEINIGI